MSAFTIAEWSAWAPGLETRDAWRAWARAPRPIEGDGAPDARFVEPMLRRRLTPLARRALHVAREACGGERWREAPLVLASRHGEVRASIELLRDIARDLPLSPTAFSHSVHNTAAGLASIVASSRAPASSIAAGRHTFGAGLVEALSLSRRGGGAEVLFVTSDDAWPPLFERFRDEAGGAYAVALVVAAVDGGDARLEIRAADPQAPVDRGAMPEALEFLSFWLGERASWTSTGFVAVARGRPS